jgi:acyl-CoA oxidase
MRQIPTPTIRQPEFLDDPTRKRNHRSDGFAQNVTARVRDLIQAIGHRLAYDSVMICGNVRQELIDVWEYNRVLEFAAWYVEQVGMTNREIHQRHVTDIERTRPHLEAIIQDFDIEKHFNSTPLASNEHEDEFMRDLPKFGDAVQGLSSTL